MEFRWQVGDIIRYNFGTLQYKVRDIDTAHDRYILDEVPTRKRFGIRQEYDNRTHFNEDFHLISRNKRYDFLNNF